MHRVNGSGRSPRARWAIALLAAALAAILLAMLIGGAGPLDRRLYEALYAGGHPGLVAVATALSLFGDPKVLVPATLIAAAWLWWHNHRHTAGTLLAVTLIGRGVNSLIKLDVHRVRPDLEPHLVVETTNSFPSGHAAGSMILFLTLALLLAHRGPWRRWAVAAAVAISIAVGMTRVMLGVHWPSDVVGGWAFGMLWVIVSLRMAEDLIERRSVRR
ncbi:MAG: phosphatase PAP2 family protein [Sphingomicrobium sp.]